MLDESLLQGQGFIVQPDRMLEESEFTVPVEEGEPFEVYVECCEVGTSSCATSETSVALVSSLIALASSAALVGDNAIARGHVSEDTPLYCLG